MDKQYLGNKFQISEVEHGYGKNIHILSDPVLFSYLATLCSPETKQPEINTIIEFIYRGLIHIVLNQEFPRKPARVVTRMSAKHPAEGTFSADLMDREQKAVCVDLARAGTFPSHICYSTLNHLLDAEGVRQDHLMMSRETDAQNKVTGASNAGCKIGGSVENSIVLIPDPMGATGSTLIQTLNLYKNCFNGSIKPGKAKKYIALHLIVTPEYLKNVQKHHSDLIVYALRLDRGLSPSDVLASRPGEKWDLEKGLNEEQYIVPGGGGFGEILNNAYV